MKRFLLLLLCILQCYVLVGQKGLAKSDEGRHCGTMEALEIRLERDKTYRKFHKEAYSISKTNQKAAIGCDASNTIVVPVAFHFQDGSVTGGCDNTNCLLTDALNQLEVLNAAFGDNTGTAQEALCPEAYQDTNGNSVASTGTCITFCLAIPPAGNAQGLTANDPPITLGAFTGGTSAGGNGAPGWGGILNIFITNNGCLGVADGIPGAANGDGVSVCGAAFGGYGTSTGCGLNTDGAYNLGATLIHEIGHYLGLYHVWGDGGCGTTDENTPGPFNVNDTPDAPSDSSGVPSGCVAGCNGGSAPTANFMDYTDDAGMSMFTQDQAQVMNYWANQLFGSSASNCTVDQTPDYVGSCTLTANFMPADGTSINICLDEGNTYELTDKTSNGPVSWNWDIVALSGNLSFSPSGNGASSMQNPTITFNGGTSGVLQITLTADDANMNSNTVVHTITFNLLSGITCPDDCEYTLELSDEYGDGWNGATLEIIQDGTSIGIYGSSFSNGFNEAPVSISLTSGANIDLVQSNGDWPTEEGFTLTDPTGNIVASLSGGSPLNQSFVANCPQTTVNVQLKLFLEGYYDTASAEMTTELNQKALIPFAHPFNVAPYNYNGAESVLFYPSTDIVDWVLVQARDANNPATVIESRACFLLKDGTVVDTDGSAGVNFTSLDTGIAYHFAVYHKSHLGIMSNNAFLASSGLYDFTNVQQNAMGVEQTKSVGSIFALYAGDFDNNGLVNNLDYNVWTGNASGVNQYVNQDVDGSGIVNNLDYNLWSFNRSKVGDPSVQF